MIQEPVLNFVFGCVGQKITTNTHHSIDSILTAPPLYLFIMWMGSEIPNLENPWQGFMVGTMTTTSPDWYPNGDVDATWARGAVEMDPLCSP